MTKHVLLALTSPRQGDEEAYNAWYNDVHIPEILTVPGILSARRFKTRIVNAPGGAQWQYAAVYEVETDDLRATLKALGEVTSPPIAALDQSASATIVAEEIFALSEAD